MNVLPLIRAVSLAAACSASVLADTLTFDLVELGGDVDLTVSGSIGSLSGWTSAGISATKLSEVEASSGAVVAVGSGPGCALYSRPTVPPLHFGAGGYFQGSPGVGQAVGFIASWEGSAFLGLPQDYSLGTPIAASATFTGQSLTTLGLTPGSHSWIFGTDTIRVNIRTGLPREQTISWSSPALESVLLLGQSQALTATASSGLPVAFKVLEGPALITGNTVTATNLGTIVLVAEQAGDAKHAAVRVERRWNQTRTVMERETFWPPSPRGKPLDLVVSGQRGYLAEGEGGLRILDLSQPAKPTTLGTWGRNEGLSGTASKVVVSGTTAVVLDDLGFQILDVSEPASIRRLSTLDESGHSFMFDGRYLINLCHFAVFDLEDPKKPVKLGSLNLCCRAGQVRDGFAYLGNSAGFHVVDLRDPSVPKIVASIGGEGLQSVTGIQIVDQVAHLAARGGYFMVDITHPAQPVRMGAFTTYEQVYAVGISGKQAVLAHPEVLGLGSRIVVLDISKPNAVRETWSTTGIGWQSGSFPISDGKAFVGGARDDVAILDLADPTGVRVLSESRFTGQSIGVTTVGDRTWLADGYGGLKVFAADGTGPVATPPSGIYPRTMARHGDLMIVAGEGTWGEAGIDILEIASGAPGAMRGSWRAERGPRAALNVAQTQDLVFVSGMDLDVYDVRDPRSPRWRGRIPVSGQTWGSMVVSGNTLFFRDLAGLNAVDTTGPTTTPPVQIRKPDGLGGFAIADGTLALLAGGSLEIWDVRTPSSPIQRGAFTHGLSASESILALSGSTAIVGSGEDVILLDISNPAQVREISRFKTEVSLGPWVAYLVVDSGTLYIARSERVQVVDIRDLASPKPVAVWESPGRVEDIRVSGGIVHLALSNHGLVALDFRDPANIRQLGIYPTASEGFQISVQGNRIATAMSNEGLLLLESKADGALVPSGSVPRSGAVRHVRVSGSRAYLTTGTSGIRVLSLEDPTKPIELAYVLTRSGVTDLQVDGDIAYLALAGSGGEILNLVDPKNPVSLGSFSTDEPIASLARIGSTLAIGSVAGRTSPTLSILDLSVPQAPITLGSVLNDGKFTFVTSMSVVGDVVHTASGSRLGVVDVHDPRNPIVLGSQSLTADWAKTDSEVEDLAVHGDRLFLARQTLGLDTYRIRQESRLLQAPLKTLPTEVSVAEGNIPLSTVLNSGIETTHRVVEGPGRIEGGRLVLEDQGLLVIRITAPGNSQFVPFESDQRIYVTPPPEMAWEVGVQGGAGLTFIGWTWGYTLERATTLSPADWTRVADEPPVEIPADGKMSFFRIRPTAQVPSNGPR